MLKKLVTLDEVGLFGGTTISVPACGVKFFVTTTSWAIINSDMWDACGAAWIYSSLVFLFFFYVLLCQLHRILVIFSAKLMK